MGATQFWQVGEGATAEKAFSSAVAAAKHEHGHGGYSGTLAEKRSFVMIDAASEAPKVVAALELARSALTVTKQTRLATRRTALRAKYEAKKATAAEVEELESMPWQIETDPAKLQELRSRLTKQIADLRTQSRRGEVVARWLLDTQDARVDEKWGPAGCIQLAARKFLFFGVASS